MNQDHSGELDLSGLSRREQQRQQLLVALDPDAASEKFKKQGGVVIATNLDRAFKKRCNDEENVELGKVEYDEKDNEQYDFGEEHDKFEPVKSKIRSKTKSVD